MYWDDYSAKGPRNQLLALKDLVDTIAPTDDNAMVLAAPGVGMQELAASPKSLNRLSASLQQMLRGISSALAGDSNGFFCAVELAKCAVVTAGVLYLCSAAPETTYTGVDFKGAKENTRGELQLTRRKLVQRSSELGKRGLPLALLNTLLNCVEVGNEAVHNPGEQKAALVAGAQLMVGVTKSVLSWSVDQVHPPALDQSSLHRPGPFQSARSLPFGGNAVRQA